MKKIGLTIIIILLSNICISQNKKEDVIYLKNGSIYKGVIIEETPNEGYKIEVAGRNVIAVPTNDVEKVERNVPPTTYVGLELGNNPQKPEKEKEKKKSNFKIRFNNQIGGIYNIGFSKVDTTSRMGIHNISSANFNEIFSLGIGLGVEFSDKLMVFPFFFDNRFFIKINDKIRFHFMLNYGVQINRYKSDPSRTISGGGLVFYPGLGLNYYIKNKLGVFFDFGYRLEHLRLARKNEYYNHTDYYDILVDGLQFRLGLSF